MTGFCQSIMIFLPPQMIEPSLVLSPDFLKRYFWNSEKWFKVARVEFKAAPSYFIRTSPIYFKLVKTFLFPSLNYDCLDQPAPPKALTQFKHQTFLHFLRERKKIINCLYFSFFFKHHGQNDLIIIALRELHSYTL